MLGNQSSELISEGCTHSRHALIVIWCEANCELVGNQHTITGDNSCLGVEFTTERGSNFYRLQAGAKGLRKGSIDNALKAAL